jgi:hypothetical protein
VLRQGGVRKTERAGHVGKLTRAGWSRPLLRISEHRTSPSFLQHASIPTVRLAGQQWRRRHRAGHGRADQSLVSMAGECCCGGSPQDGTPTRWCWCLGSAATQARLNPADSSGLAPPMIQANNSSSVGCSSVLVLPFPALYSPRPPCALPSLAFTSCALITRGFPPILTSRCRSGALSFFFRSIKVRCRLSPWWPLPLPALLWRSSSRSPP